MRISATNKMVAELNRVAKATDKPYTFSYQTMDTNIYGWLVGDVFDGYDWGDYNSNTGKMRALKVTYPCEYYANPRYITTHELNAIYEAGDTWESFANRVMDSVEI